MSPDGSNRTALTSGEAYDGAPNWSPDGTSIVFERRVDDAAYDIYVVRWNGTGLTNVTNSDEDEGVPAWSPDGTRIVFAGGAAGRQIVHVRPDGSQPTLVTAGDGTATHPDWGPR